MARKPQSPRDDAAEYKRFLETAKKLGTDETPGSFDRAFKKFIAAHPPKTVTPSPAQNRSQRKRGGGHSP